MKQFRFAAGETIFAEGDPSDYAYLIWSGDVEILKVTPQGESRLAVLGKDEFLGEMGVIDEQPRSASARAITDVVCSGITQDEFTDMLLHRPDESLSLLRVLFDRLRTMNRQLAKLTEAAPPSNPTQRIVLLPRTPEMEAVLPASGLEVTRLPYRIGRKPASRSSALLVLNELELPDTAGFHVSFNHLLIDYENGQILVRDRGSNTGTQVDGKRIGTGAAEDFAVVEGDNSEVVIGADSSPYRFAVQLREDSS